MIKRKLLTLAISGCLLVPVVAGAADAKYFNFTLTSNYKNVPNSTKNFHGTGKDDDRSAYVINTLGENNPGNIVHHMINLDGQPRSEGRTHGKNNRVAYGNTGTALYSYTLNMRLPLSASSSYKVSGTWAADNY